MPAKKNTAKSAKPRQGIVKPAKSAKAPAKPSKAVKAAAKPVKSAKPVKPAAKSVKPAAKPSKPVKPVKPAAKPSKSVKPAKPVKAAAKPSKPVKPAKRAAKPVKAPAKPAAKPSKPVKPVVKPLLKVQVSKPEVKKVAAKVSSQSAVPSGLQAPKVVPVKPRAALVASPPPAPVKPPFVPMKTAAVPAAGLVTNNGNGTHSPAFVQKQRQRLLDLRDELVDSMSGMTRDTIRNAPEGSEASGSGQHQGDAGSDAYDRDFALSVLAKEQDALYEIEQALRRIQAGTYGICEISGRKILQARLEVIPFARLTVECQAQWEKEYGKRRFRPSNEVGFSGGKYVEEEDSETVSLDEDEE
jgi:RNA polymerase-binding transcription factor DksA